MILSPDNIIANDIVVEKKNNYRRKKHPTQRPIIDCLKKLKSASVTEIIRHSRTEGHDLIRVSVNAALERLMKRGLVKKNRFQYSLIDQNENQT